MATSEDSCELCGRECVSVANGLRIRDARTGTAYCWLCALVPGPIKDLMGVVAEEDR